VHLVGIIYYNVIIWVVGKLFLVMWYGFNLLRITSSSITLQQFELVGGRSVGQSTIQSMGWLTG